MNPEELILRDAKDSERELIAEVMLESYQQYAFDMPQERWEQYRDSIRNSVYGNAPYARIVAEIDGRIVGSVQMFLSSEAAYGNPEMGIHSPIIRLLAVHPSARGRGVATALIREAARRALELGATTLNLHTSDMMASAVKLYEKLGFQRHYETDTTNGETLVKGYRIDVPGSLLLQNVV
ncbi:GNAT family N-acetyltransferase [Paenibacillus rhizosphaerae]|uniref:GNAT family N-acetyltransferase n=1 Tax=Paenibacillus rhizosphaerae TaxID=297318 RepID=A0A1R1ECM1_9BACL|nr:MULTISPECIES: GNAT family N-acetyltransferase [Paenibacillus]OMF49557.1 GNAT family N-acetyltransferase [Paenibacillus rhizosphaerae]OXL87366.1 GCN5 family acetyltransferase [Paenibacillus sp. SSG-1]